MSKITHYNTPAQKRKISVRKKLHGTALRPRLSVLRSNEHIYLQVIDDDKGVSLIGISDGNKKKLKGTKTEKAIVVAKKLATKLKAKKIKQLVFDRGAYRYHGRVKAVADTLRQEGLDF
jgi:large subunit ribosomal protein L18